VRLVGFIIRIYHDVRSPERKNCTCLFRQRVVLLLLWLIHVEYNTLHSVVVLDCALNEIQLHFVFRYIYFCSTCELLRFAFE